MRCSLLLLAYHLIPLWTALLGETHKTEWWRTNTNVAVELEKWELNTARPDTEHVLFLGVSIQAQNILHAEFGSKQITRLIG